MNAVKTTISKRVLLLFCALIIALTPVFSGCSSSVSSSAEPTVKDDYVTREDAVSAFVQSIGRNNLSGSDYNLIRFEGTDEIVDTEYWDDYSKAVSKGIVREEYDDPLRPKDNVTRLEALIMLSISLPEDLPSDKEDRVYTDVPELEQNYLSLLAYAGLMDAYPEGELGAKEPVTAEEFQAMIDTCDSFYNTVTPGDSYYGYINQKAFRNANIETPSSLDALHGAVVLSNGTWSYMDDMNANNTSRLTELLTNLMDGKMTYEKDTSEQRVHDLLECIAAPESMNEKDAAQLQGYRDKILAAKTIGELIEATNAIYAETGVATMLSVAAGTEVTTNENYPQVGLVSAGIGGLLNFYSPMKEQNGPIYAETLKGYGEVCGLTLADGDVEKAVYLQEQAAEGINYYDDYYSGISFLKLLDPEYDINAAMAKIAAEHPGLDAATGVQSSSPATLNTREKTDEVFKNVKLTELIDTLGFGEFENILFNSDEAMAQISEALNDESYLNAFKLNAVLALADGVQTDISDAEATERGKINTIRQDTIMLAAISDGELDGMVSSLEEMLAQLETDDGILSASNLSKLGNLLPNEVGIIFCHNYYDESTSEDIEKMIRDIWDAYVKRFEVNEWMDDNTREAAIKKIKNMVAVIGYPDNLVSPEIAAMEDGGTLFNNIIRVNQANMQMNIKICREPLYDRTMMAMTPETVNACYVPTLNSMNIPAGILQWPVYDKDATYAQNLGAIGSIIAHEIGHAFDASGARFDENGCLKNWWTDADYGIFKEKQQQFVDYYQQYEVVSGVVQNSETTITENMADFAGIQCVFDILGDDKDAQKEAMESFARMWAQLGTEKVLTSSGILNDVHSNNGVRVNACVGSLDAFYELYDISEDDPMYVAPENRLKLW